MKLNTLSHEKDCCEVQIPSKTLKVSMLEMVDAESITSMWKNNEAFRDYWQMIMPDSKKFSTIARLHGTGRFYTGGRFLPV